MSLTPIRDACDVILKQRDYANSSADNAVKADVGMKWFRSNIRLGSRLALAALAIQAVLSFGHFHEGPAQAAAAPAQLLQTGHGVALAAARFAVARENPRSGHEPSGHSGDGCAICAVMALASAMTVATPPVLELPARSEFSYLAIDAGLFDLNPAGVAFQPRAPPIV